MNRLEKALLAATSAATLVMTAALFAKAFLPSAEKRREREADDFFWDGADTQPLGYHDHAQAVDEPPAKEAMDEGFDNIMRYSVLGKTGFETE